jgi:hypothetical protein
MKFYLFLPWHSLYFLPLPQGQGEFRLISFEDTIGFDLLAASTKSIC